MTGFDSKRQMVADKLQEPEREALKLAAQAVLDRWNSPKWEWAAQGPTADLMADLQKALAKPAQEPVACVTGTYGGMFVVGPLNAAMVLPVGMALYAGPQRPWVGLTDEAIWLEYQRFWPFHPAEEPTLAKDIAKFAHAIEAKLKEKNNG